MRIHATDVVIRHSQRLGARDIAILVLSAATLIVAGATGLLFLVAYNLQCGGFEYVVDSSGELVISRTGGALLGRLYPHEPGTDHGEAFIERCLVVPPAVSDTALSDATEYPVGAYVELVGDGRGRYRTTNLVDAIGEPCRLGEDATVYVAIIHADRTAVVRYDRRAAASP